MGQMVMWQTELTALVVGVALVGWALLMRNLDRRFAIPESKLPWLFFGGGLFVIYLALRAASWLLALFGRI